MNTGSTSEPIRINRSLHLLFPPFREIVERGLAIAHAQGLWAYVFEGWRSTERQAYLYAQGRTTPGAKVTWVKPGFSLHQYGLAVDLVFDKFPLQAGLQWTWEGGYSDANGDNYDKLARIMKAEGLEWLGDKNIERAHFQLTTGLTIQEIKTIADARGTLGAWDEIERRLFKRA
jgi:peptidoglycan L-alanyl-D-glutamate endopeptidase CwlK